MGRAPAWPAVGPAVGTQGVPGGVCPRPQRFGFDFLSQVPRANLARILTDAIKP